MAELPGVRDGEQWVALELRMHEALARAALSARQFQVLHALIAETIGDRKRREVIASSELASTTGVSEGNVRVCLTKLIAWGVVVEDVAQGRRRRVLGLELDVSRWRVPGRSQRGASRPRGASERSADGAVVESEAPRPRDAERPAHGADTAPPTGRSLKREQEDTHPKGVNSQEAAAPRQRDVSPEASTVTAAAYRALEIFREAYQEAFGRTYLAQFQDAVHVQALLDQGVTLEEFMAFVDLYFSRKAFRDDLWLQNRKHNLFGLCDKANALRDLHQAARRNARRRERREERRAEKETEHGAQLSSAETEARFAEILTRRRRESP